VHESIKGKVIIVTGGASGIGKAISMMFARYGAKVYIADIDGNKAKQTVMEAEDAGLSIIFQKTDVSVQKEVMNLIYRVENEEHCIDVVVNNAGINIIKKVTELEEAEWDQLMNINLKSVFLTAKYTLPGMIARKKGCFINIGSISGLAADYGFSVYNAAKAGMINLTKNIAVNYAINGIRANIVCPGAISTPLIEEAQRRSTRCRWGAYLPYGTTEVLIRNNHFRMEEHVLYLIFIHDSEIAGTGLKTRIAIWACRVLKNNSSVLLISYF